MTREIKFRAWNKPDKRMIYDANVMGANVAEIQAEWEFMQYTGLKDKNGKEIYEGDTVRVDNRIYEVLFCNASFKFMEMKSGLEGAIDFFPACVLSHCHCDKNIGTFEVIGNIYENPELKEG